MTSPSPISSTPLPRIPISACIIVRDEPLLRGALTSLRPHVDEIVVVDTGSEDDASYEVAKELADKVAVRTECNSPDDEIEDFSIARNAALELATHDTILTLDADDVLVGGERLQTIATKVRELAQGKPHHVLMPYHIGFDEKGACTLQSMRTRLVSRRQDYQWVNPCHEDLVPRTPEKSLAALNSDIFAVHKKPASSYKKSEARNLRILQTWYAREGEKNPRLLYMLGRSLAVAGPATVNEGCQLLARYLDEGDYLPEQFEACMLLTEYLRMQGQPRDAIPLSFRALDFAPKAAQGYFDLAASYASSGDLTTAAHWAEIGLAQPTDVPLGASYDPQARDRAQLFLKKAQTTIG